MPSFLKLNPIKEYVDLWNDHPNKFWSRYWRDKKDGILPSDFGFG